MTAPRVRSATTVVRSDIFLVIALVSRIAFATSKFIYITALLKPINLWNLVSYRITYL